MERQTTPRLALDGRFGTVQFQQLLELLADRNGGAVFVVDSRSTVVYWSRSAEREFGRSATEQVGQHCLMGAACATCLPRCALADNQPPHDARVRRADGSLGLYRRYVFPLHAEDGSYVGGAELLVPVEEPLTDLGVGGTARFGELVTSDPGGIEAFGHLHRVATLRSPACILAEETELRARVAHALHAASGRAGAMHVADGIRPLGEWLGRSTGTVFVDEPARLEPRDQLALMTAIADPGADRRLLVGASRRASLDVRVGLLRPDLGAILGATEVSFPSLAQRPHDVRRLLDEAIAAWNAGRQRSVTGIDPEALRQLLQWSWPGGEAELRATLEHACSKADRILGSEHLPPMLRSRGTAPAEDEAGALKAAREIRRIQKALAAADGNVSVAAESLGISRTTLYRRRRALGV